MWSGLRRRAAHLTGQALEDGDERVRPHVAGILLTFRVSQAAFGALAGQLLYARLQLAVPNTRRPERS